MRQHSPSSSLRRFRPRDRTQDREFRLRADLLDHQGGVNDKSRPADELTPGPLVVGPGPSRMRVNPRLGSVPIFPRENDEGIHPFFPRDFFGEQGPEALVNATRGG